MKNTRDTAADARERKVDEAKAKSEPGGLSQTWRLDGGKESMRYG
jgi:hypothetical protein